MASTFVIHARRDWTFQLVLLGSRLRLEGWCDGPEGRCTTWMQPSEAPHEGPNSSCISRAAAGALPGAARR
ncbi:MAG: hypothetical protein ACKO5F_00190 [Synechococcus sp.]